MRQPYHHSERIVPKSERGNSLFPLSGLGTRLTRTLHNSHVRISTYGTKCSHSGFTCTAYKTIYIPTISLSIQKSVLSAPIYVFVYLSIHLATGPCICLCQYCIHLFVTVFYQTLTTSLASAAKGVSFREDLERKEEESVREPLSRRWALIRRRMAFTVARNNSVWSMVDS